jgi:hypothetical protein
MQDRPTAAELLEALGEFVRDRAANARDRWERFQFQVAANSLGVLQRELQLEDGYMREEWTGLDALLGAESIPGGQVAFTSRLEARNEELVARIQAGEFDAAGEDALLRHLCQTVLNKVRVASPREAV